MADENGQKTAGEENNKTDVKTKEEEENIIRFFESKGRKSEWSQIEGQWTVTGYALQKKTEMEANGAACSVSSNAVRCDNATSGITCFVFDNGRVDCYTSDFSHFCYIYIDGSILCG